MSVLALVRPDAWNLPLLLHVLGASVLVGSLVLAASSLAGRRGGGSLAANRLAFRALLWGALPAWILMRGAAQWIASKESLDDSNATWLTIGFTTSEGGLLFLIAATVVAGRAVRRARRSQEQGTDATLTLDRVAGVLVGLLILAYVVAIWAMTTKPI
jgi:hypothetical protein